jgi:hypothetical protein
VIDVYSNDDVNAHRTALHSTKTMMAQHVADWQKLTPADMDRTFPLVQRAGLTLPTCRPRAKRQSLFHPIARTRFLPEKTTAEGAACSRATPAGSPTSGRPSRRVRRSPEGVHD